MPSPRKERWLFLSIIFAVGVLRLSAEPIASQSSTSTPAPLTLVGEQAAISVIDTLLLFDHLVTRSTTAISPDYLERVAEPSSKFHESYLEYKQGRVSRAELVRRLPHVAMIGDSLSKNFYISSPASIFWRARTERGKDWFLDTDPSPNGVFSLYERLDQLTPLVATEYSTAGAKVGPTHTLERFTRRLARTHNFEGQIKRLMEAKKFPDLILIWLGANNTQWLENISEADRRNPAKRLQQFAREFRSNYTEQLKTLIDRARIQDHRVAIVVFGVADFKTFFEMRHQAAALHARDARLYPYYPASCRYFEALQPAYESNTIKLGLMMNTGLKQMVAELNSKSPADSNVRLQYSDALAKIDLSRIEGFHRNDAWHPSVFGHNVLSQTAFRAIGPSLKFVGIAREPRKSTVLQVARDRARQ
jgi:lysophospholipase L1-like esterase